MPQSRLLPIVMFLAGLVLAADGPVAGAEPPLLTARLERSHLWYTYVGPGGIRYFVAQISFQNASEDEQRVETGDIRLLVDGREFLPVSRVPQLQGFSFHDAGESFRFRDLDVAETLKVAAGESASTWLVYPDLPRSADIPRLTLQWESGGRTESIDVNDVHARRLGLTAEKLGPQQILGLLTISGTLDTINAGTLVSEVDRLAGEGVSRVVIAFAESAGECMDDLRSWLQQTAAGDVARNVYAQLPAFPATVREFHVAVLPADGADAGRSANVHRTASGAVQAALDSVFEVVPTPMLVRSLHEGHRLVRFAALVSGGARIPADLLPTVIRLAGGDDRLLQRGALAALRHFDDPRAIDTLLGFAEGPDGELATLAVECLAASRQAAAHQALQRWLEDTPHVEKPTLITILARYPRPQWADVIARLVEDAERDEPEVRREGLRALGQMGHPRLIELCAEALDSSDETLQQTAFGLLAEQSAPAAETLAMEFTLEHLRRNRPPTPLMISLLERVRDPRAVPLLMARLDEKDRDRTHLIKLLVQLGGPEIPELLAEQFDGFAEQEQAVVLSHLAQLHSPRLRDLAPRALESRNNSLVNAAVGGLQVDGSPEAVAVLAEALSGKASSTARGPIITALRDIGTQEAREALLAARRSSDSRQRDLASRALRDLQTNSPGMPHLKLGNDRAQKEQWDAAISAFTEAIELDPSLPPAYAGRAYCYLQLEQIERAGADYRRAAELDPDDDIAVTGLAITQTRRGDYKAGIRTITEAAERFADNATFAYNAACVYGRAVEQLAKQKRAPERDPEHKALHKEYQQAALDELRRAVKLGFEDFDWMKEDPDLASLRELDAFQQIATREGGKE